MPFLKVACNKSLLENVVLLTVLKVFTPSILWFPVNLTFALSKAVTPKFVLAVATSNKSDKLLPFNRQPDKVFELPPLTPIVYSIKSVKVVPPVFVAVDSINHHPKKVAFFSAGFNTYSSNLAPTFASVILA